MSRVVGMIAALSLAAGCSTILGIEDIEPPDSGDAGAGGGDATTKDAQGSDGKPEPRHDGGTHDATPGMDGNGPSDTGSDVGPGETDDGSTDSPLDDDTTPSETGTDGTTEPVTCVFDRASSKFNGGCVFGP